MIRIENMHKNGDLLGNGRREFLKGVLGAGAFVLGVSGMPEGLFAAGVSGSAGDPFPPAAEAPLRPGVYLAIDTDGTAYIVAHRSEMGNGVRTSLPRIVADELDADWARVKVVQAIGSEEYGDQDTDGSHSVVSFFAAVARSGSDGAVDASARGSAEVGRAGSRMLDRIAPRLSQSVGEKDWVWRIGDGGFETGGAEERRAEAEAAQ